MPSTPNRVSSSIPIDWPDLATARVSADPLSGYFDTPTTPASPPSGPPEVGDGRCNPSPHPVESTPHPVRRRRIKAIGVELEGGWQNNTPAGMHRDGSVTVDARYVGEISSEPLPDIAAAEAWMRVNYPQQVNSSCGLHVHVSTNELNYSRLMEPEFAQFFEGRMAEFLSQGLANGRPGYDLLRQRFQGLNRYCQKKFIPEQQLFMRDRYGDVTTHPRYAQLNFCYARHGTLECRMFPCFPNVDDGVAAVKAFYDTVFDYLGQFKAVKDESSTLVIPLAEITSQ
jgi:hypothetical protein